jgi:hypothetical protein
MKEENYNLFLGHGVRRVVEYKYPFTNRTMCLFKTTIKPLEVKSILNKTKQKMNYFMMSYDTIFLIILRLKFAFIKAAYP